MFARAKSIDISTGGMLLEVPTAIPVRVLVTVKCDELKLRCNALVKHCTRQGSRFRVGLEFPIPVKLPGALGN